MTISLRARMVLTYSLFACAFIALLSFATSRFASGQFAGFVSDSADEQSRRVAFAIAEQYSPETGFFDVAALRAVAASYARQGFLVTVVGADGSVLWESRDDGYRAALRVVPGDAPAGERLSRDGAERLAAGRLAALRGLPGAAGEGGFEIRVGGGFAEAGGSLEGVGSAGAAGSAEAGGGARLRGRAGAPSPGALRAQAFPITHGFREVGLVIVESGAPYLLDENQAAFIGSIRRFLLWAGVAFALLGVVVSALLAGALSEPMLKAARAARRIADGDWSARVPERRRTREAAELSRSLNHLAATLEDGDRRQKRLTTDVAHELRTPLATLRGNMEAMIDGVWEPTGERLASCHEEIMRLSRLVEDLGRLSVLERGDLALSLGEFDLGALLSDAAGRFEQAASGKGVALSVGAAGAMPIVADRDRLAQVFANLLSNAVKYTDSGEIAVRAREESPSEYAVAVSDTGIGVPADELPLVFERFFRSDKSRSRATGGAGIGLTIAAAIASAHGGRIEAASENGRGSVFTVFLPKAGAPS